MEGESGGVQQAHDKVGQDESQQQGGQEPQKDAVSGDAGADYAAQFKARDAEIEALQAKVAEAAKTAEATESLGKGIANLKARLADERTEFALRSAGARSVTAAKVLLAEHDSDVAALVKADPWLFEARGSNQGGATGLEPAGASGDLDDQYMRRWERIAGLADKGKEQGMPNNIAAIRNYTTILDRVYQREVTSSCLNSPARMARASRNAKEIMVPKISMTGLGDYTRNVGYKTGSINFSYEMKAFNYDRGI